MYCGECGAKLKKNAQFCEECGAKVKKEEKSKTSKKVETSKPKTKMSKKKKIILTVVVILVLALGISFSILSNRFGPKGVATEYLDALISNDANRIYNSLNLSGDTTFTTKEEFIKLFEDESNSFKNVVNYKLTDISYNEGNLSATVKFTVALKDSDDDETISIKVVKNSKKKFLIFDNWQVANINNSIVVEDYQLSVPKSSKVSVNNIELTEKYLSSDKSTDELDVYIIPQIFVSDATIKTTLPCGITVEEVESISNYNSSYTASVSIDNLDEAMESKLKEQVKSDITKIYSNIIGKKDWNSIKDSYSYNNVDLTNLKDEYEDMYDDLVTDSDITLKKFEITDVKITDIALKNGRLEIDAKYSYNYSIEYKNYNNEVKTKDGKSSYTSTLTYDYFENNFKLYDLYGTVTYFSTW